MIKDRAAAIREIIEKWYVNTPDYVTISKFQLDELIEQLTALDPDWIPVAERLPEGGKFVKVIVNTEYGVDIEYWVETHFRCEYPVREATVTHWRPLPAPPKNEAK